MDVQEEVQFIIGLISATKAACFLFVGLFVRQE